MFLSRCHCRGAPGGAGRRSGFLLLFLMYFSGCNGPPPATVPVPKAQAVAEAEQMPPKEDFGGVEAFRRQQLKGLQDGIAWAVWGVWIPIIVGIIVAFVLWFTPTSIPSSRPFDPKRDRARQKAPPPSGEREDFWTE